MASILKVDTITGVATAGSVVLLARVTQPRLIFSKDCVSLGLSLTKILILQ